jgi:hypothetical protein
MILVNSDRLVVDLKNIVITGTCGMQLPPYLISIKFRYDIISLSFI